MTLQNSVANICLKQGHFLTANCKRINDSDDPSTWPESSIDINEYIGNVNGAFVWGGEHFVLTADDLHVGLQGDSIILTANLLILSEKKWNNKVQLNLSERIVIKDGEFTFQ
ncbi:hypothetical protein DFQ26_002888 [Actinomortierella ambigua]|nr:hypothetical protein DFQ26_002888 [Actinomortierella ambigua]